MKKVLIITMLVLGFTTTAQNVKFNGGINLAIPVGDLSDTHSFAIHPEISYLSSVTNNFYLGGSLSYLHIFGKEIETGRYKVSIPDLGYLPIAASARFKVDHNIKLGLDLGYAIAISPDNAKGGFYYRPLLGYGVSRNLTLQFAYTGIKRENTTGSLLGLGLTFSL